MTEVRPFLSPDATQITDTSFSQPIPDKALRGKFHQTLREAFNGKFVSAHKENEGGDPSIDVKWAPSAGGKGGKNQKRSRDDLEKSRAQREKALGAFPLPASFSSTLRL